VPNRTLDESSVVNMVQKIHGEDQVTSIEDIDLETEYVRHPYNISNRFRFAKQPTPGDRFVDIEFMYEPLKGHRSQISLADHGIIPYEAGDWNTQYWISPAE